MRNRILRGISASPGIVMLKAVLYGLEKKIEYKPKILEKEGNEVKKFKDSLDIARYELELIRDDFARRTNNRHARILDAQLLVIEDKSLIEGTIKRIKEKNLTAFQAFKETVNEILSGFKRVKDEYIKARIADIRDVTNRILRDLSGESKELPLFATKHIVIAEDLAPSQTARFKKEIIGGFATDFGGNTSHTAIMARALGIPAVVGLKRVTKWVKTGEEVIIDGNHGIVIIDPNEATRRIYEDKIRRFQKYEKELLSLSTLPCQTLDGHRIELACNIELPEEVNLALSYGTDIVGLMRTEFLYLKSDTLPTEEEQFEIYKNIATKTTSVTIRTLDLGGDKLTKYIERGIEEVNPALGCRGIRFSLSRRDIFIDQLKAIIRASAYGNVKILLPMVHEVDEVRKVKSCINKAFSLIKKTNAPCPDTIEIGVMIEIPSAVFVTSAIAKEVDFFSIGSNDLTQYTLACDRTNSRVSQIYNPLHPAVLRLIRYTTDASHGARKWVGCCGELASYPPAIPILIGLGVDELSVAPIYILEVKKIIRALSMDEARIIADEVSGLRTNKEVKKYIKRIKERIPVIKEIMEKREYKDM